eukprot:Filipodium_phascolosomae@DN5924_c0_g1_i1.p1
MTKLKDLLCCCPVVWHLVKRIWYREKYAELDTIEGVIENRIVGKAEAGRRQTTGIDRWAAGNDLRLPQQVDDDKSEKVEELRVSVQEQNDHAVRVARLLVAALQGDVEAVNALERGKLTPTGLKLIFDRFSLEDVKHICTQVRKSENITSIEFGCNSFGDPGVSIISEHLRGSHNILSLSIWGNSVCDDGAASLSDLVTSLPNLHTLVLSNNEITDTGISSLAMSLATSIKLRSLDLSVNGGISDPGIVAFVRAIKDAGPCEAKRNDPDLHYSRHDSTTSGNSHKLQQKGGHVGCLLENLSLNNCSILNEGAEALANWIRWPSCSLQKLDIANNMIEDAGAVALASALRSTQLITFLDISGNPVGTKGVESLLQTLADCTERPNATTLQIGMEDLKTTIV